MINNNLFLVIFALMPLIALIGVIILRRWRAGIILIFIWLLMEDIIRRFIPGQPGQIMLIKDVLVLLVYFSFFAELIIKNKKIWLPSFIAPLLFLFSFIFIDIFNYRAPNLFFGFIGLRSYLWYLPLTFLGYYMFDDKEKLLKFCRTLVYAAIPLFVLIALQYVFYSQNYSSFNFLLKPFSTAHQIHSSNSGDISLLSSVFGTAHRYARFSMLLFFLGVGLLTTKKSKILIISVTSAFLGIILSGSRTAFVLTAIGAALFLLFGTYVKNNKPRYLLGNINVKIFSLITAILLILWAMFAGGDLSSFHISAFYEAYRQRIPWVFEEITRSFSEAKFLGIGTGTMSQGRDYIPGGVEWYNYQTYVLRDGFWFESGIGKIFFELGFLGAALFFLFWGYLFHRIKKEINKLGISPLRNLALAISIFSFLILMWFLFIHHQTFGDATTLVVLWFFIGALFSFNKLKAL